MNPINLTIKIDNNLTTPGDINVYAKVVNAYPVINWSFSTIRTVTIDEYTGLVDSTLVVDQLGYEIRIGTTISGGTIGTSAFIGDRVSTNFIYSKDKFWNYVGEPLERGRIYYGQINVKDEAGRDSDWVIFSFEYNSLPYVQDVKIEPLVPLVTDDLLIHYNYYDDGGDVQQGTILRWFKNGIYQKQFDNALIVKSRFLQVDDIWSVDVLPSDGYEYGVRITSPSVRVGQTTLVVSSLEVFPRNPNENDVLRAKYNYESLVFDDVPNIRWFINGQLVKEFNDLKFARPNVVPGDSVKFEIRPKGSTIYISSEEVEITYSDFVVYDIMVDGRKESLQVSTISPTISWKVYRPYNKSVNYVSIQIGTFYQADNIYTTVIQTDREIFLKHINLLERGIDYYITISVSDTQTFNKYISSHFRISGSRWEESVDNSTGWTIETLFIIGEIEQTTQEVYDETSYQVIKFNDGNRFGEVRIHNQRISFASEDFTLSSELDTTKANVLTIVGRGDNIKIYLNRNLIIDGTGLFTQASDKKTLEIGNTTGKDFVVNYKYFYYTISGDFYPGISTEYSDIKFHNFLEFENNESVALRSYVKDYTDYKIFGVNPDDVTESGSIYALVPGREQEHSTVSRTFAPINKIRSSPDGKKIAVAHSKGISLVTGYIISAFDYEIDFYNLGLDASGNYIYTYPNSYTWELMQNLGYEAGYFESDGFHINTISNIRD
ncbi:hypothetical protein LCGC14_1777310 [marine sediment metagenome]|uniref:Uncharacterized protein n=1 Tax=marine sediment metagenome TaxID=412755 RepID=A0A0F9GWD7_9ZZZZ